MEIIFVTSNSGKFKEVELLGEKSKIKVSQSEIDIPEIRGSIEEIAEDKARKAYALIGKPVVVDDSGLFILALKDFPGAFSKFILRTLGNERVLKLMESESNKYAEFRACTAYFDGSTVKTFMGICAGTIISDVKGRGENGFGFDPIFLPEDHSKTFAEDFQYKQKVSHRVKAYKQLFTFLSTQNSE